MTGEEAAAVAALNVTLRGLAADIRAMTEVVKELNANIGDDK